jgi:Family of unknown function (DUF6328)
VPERSQKDLDRELIELLNELRVTLPGVQVLFAFLLVVPFNQGFTRMTEFERKPYFAVLLCTALASMLLIAPTIHHRILFRQRDKEHLVLSSNRLTIAGLGVLALGMTGAVLLITHFMFGGLTAAVTGGLVLLAFALLWYAKPLRRRREQGRRDE